MAKRIFNAILFFISILFNGACSGQAAHTVVGGGCDGCELMYVGMPAAIRTVDSSAGWREDGIKLVVQGRVFKKDGITPAAGIIIYYWQTDARGYYSPAPGMPAAARRHGHIRGWVKTGSNGGFSIYTIRPSPYPHQNVPAHIHTAIKEQNMNEYYIDEWVFDNDPLLTSEKRRQLENRGGSGILKTLSQNRMQVVNPVVYLGRNIPGYPDPLGEVGLDSGSNQAKNSLAIESGLPIGQESPSFVPFHAWGPDKGSRACPVCKYGKQKGVLYFVGNHPDFADIRKWLKFLENKSARNKEKLKVYFIYGDENSYSKTDRISTLQQLGIELGIQNMALTFVPSLADRESEVWLNNINLQTRNTFIIYRNRTIIGKFANLTANAASYQWLNNILQ